MDGAGGRGQAWDPTEGEATSPPALSRAPLLPGDPAYVQQAAVPLGAETHGGEDVAVFARGPWAHLVHGVQEQSFVAHVMAFAACLEPYTSDCDLPPPSGPTAAGHPGPAACTPLLALLVGTLLLLLLAPALH